MNRATYSLGMIYSAWGEKPYQLPAKCPRCGNPNHMHASVERGQYLNTIHEYCGACTHRRQISATPPPQPKRELAL